MTGCGSPHADDWWSALDDEVLGCLDGPALSATELAAKLGVSEEAAVSLVTMLARDGKVRLTRIERGA